MKNTTQNRIKPRINDFRASGGGCSYEVWRDFWRLVQFIFQLGNEPWQKNPQNSITV